VREIVYTEDLSQSCAGLDDFFDAPDNAVLEHNFDPVRVMRGFREDSLDDAFCQLAAALVLLFDNPDPHAGLNIGSCLAIHHEMDCYPEVPLRAKYPCRHLTL